MSEYFYHIGMELRIYPSWQQKQKIKQNGSAARFLYNRLAAVSGEAYRLKQTAALCPADRTRLEYLQTAYANPVQIANSIPFLQQCDSDMVQHVVRNYRTAWKNVQSEHAGIPHFHKFDHTYVYQTSNHYSTASLRKYDRVIGLWEGKVRFLDQNHIQIPILGRLRFKASKKRMEALLSRTCETRIGTVTIRMDACGDCYAVLSIGSDEPFHTPYPQTHAAAGIDVNLSNFLTDSDGTVIDSPRYLKQSEAKLLKLQRSLSRKQEAAKRDHRKLQDSRNCQKTRRKLAECHRHVARQRLDFLRKLADAEVKSHDYLFCEDLKVQNLLQNHALAKAISDSGWRTFRTLLEQSAAKRGKTFAAVNPRNTTQTCSACGYVSHGDTRIVLGQEEWTCPQCGTHHIRDWNAAVNIKNAGLALLQEAGVPISVC